MTTSGQLTVLAIFLSLVLFTTIAAAAVVRPGDSVNSTTSQTPSQTGEVTAVQGCRVISESGTYVLMEDIQNGGEKNFTYISEACIRIEASNVTFDGNGYIVDGFGVSDTTAIQVQGDDRLTNVTVRDVRITRWNRAVYFANVTNGVIRDANVSGNSFGIFVENSTAVTVRNNTAHEYFVGIYLGNTEAKLADNTFGANRSNAIVRERSSG